MTLGNGRPGFSKRNLWQLGRPWDAEDNSVNQLTSGQRTGGGHKPLPLYKQLVEELRQHMASGKLAPTDALPSENKLVDQFKVSRVTVRQALAILEKEGLIYRQQ